MSDLGLEETDEKVLAQCGIKKDNGKLYKVVINSVVICTGLSLENANAYVEFFKRKRILSYQIMDPLGAQKQGDGRYSFFNENDERIPDLEKWEASAYAYCIQLRQEQPSVEPTPEPSAKSGYSNRVRTPSTPGRKGP